MWYAKSRSFLPQRNLTEWQIQTAKGPFLTQSHYIAQGRKEKWMRQFFVQSILDIKVLDKTFFSLQCHLRCWPIFSFKNSYIILGAISKAPANQEKSYCICSNITPGVHRFKCALRGCLSERGLLCKEGAYTKTFPALNNVFLLKNTEWQS